MPGARGGKDHSGFTLIELLLVVIILGVLSGIAVFAVNPFMDRATEACRETDDDLRLVQDAAADARLLDGIDDLPDIDCGDD